MNPMRKPLVLRSLTVRGIGSYLHGARLDIRPLTVLCGPNGGGKSTWLRVLRLLCNSTDALPFRLQPSDSRLLNTLANIYLDSYRLDDPLSAGNEYDKALRKVEAEKPDDESKYGPLGTIGLRIDVLDIVDFESSDDMQCSSPLDEADTGLGLIQFGRCTAGSRIDLRITHPLLSPWGLGLITLFVNSRCVVHLEKPADEASYTISLPYSWLDEDVGSEQLVPVARAKLEDSNFKDIEVLDGYGTGDDKAELCEGALRRLNQIAKAALNGTFQIGAIRKVLTQEEIAAEDRWQLENPRFVGSDGTYTHAVYQENSSALMVQSPTHLANPFLDKRVDWSAPEPFYWEMVTQFLSILPGFRRVMGEYMENSTLQTYEEVADAINHACDDEQFVHGILNRSGESQNAERLDPEQRRQRVDQFLRQIGIAAQQRPILYPFELYYAWWMHFLVESHPTVLGVDSDSLAYWWEDESKPPVGTAFGPRIDREWRYRHHYLNFESGHERYYHPTFFGSGRNEGPWVLSSGFHQIAPIVVQAGLMKIGELLTIENPEVHLHPRLQLKLTEFLLEHAIADRNLILETHSDLVVYRVLRAILEEEISQGKVNIAFVDLEESASGPQYSVMTSIAVDDQGRITNWPSGFLDEQVKEARRLLDIMYGHPDEYYEEEDL